MRVNKKISTAEQIYSQLEFKVSVHAIFMLLDVEASTFSILPEYLCPQNIVASFRVFSFQYPITQIQCNTFQHISQKVCHETPETKKLKEI